MYRNRLLLDVESNHCLTFFFTRQESANVYKSAVSKAFYHVSFVLSSMLDLQNESRISYENANSLRISCSLSRYPVL